MMAGMTMAPSGPERLLEELFGPVLDVQLVLKSMPDQADVHINTPDPAADRRKRRITAGLSAIGAAAGTAGLGYAAYKTGGAYRTARLGEKAVRQKGVVRATRRAAVGAAIKEEPFGTGLVPLEVAGLGGEVMATRILHGDTKQRQPMAKRSVPLHPEIKTLARKVVQFWKPPTVPPTGAAGAAAPKAAAAAGTPLKRADVKAAQKAADRTTQLRNDAGKAQAVGTDVARMVGTKSGKVATGTLAVVGAKKVTAPRQSGYEYAPDAYAYGKRDGDVTFRGEFSKFDDAKRQAFGWASVVTKDGSPVLDRQGDYISIEDLEDAAYTYVHKSRVGGDMHKRDGDAPHHVSDMIESIVFTPEKIKALNLPDGFPEGWWVGYQIHDEDTWAEVRKRGRTGFSIHGRGIRKDVDIDELMGAR